MMAADTRGSTVGTGAFKAMAGDAGMSIGGRVWRRRGRLELRIGVVCALLLLMSGVAVGESGLRTIGDRSVVR